MPEEEIQIKESRLHRFKRGLGFLRVPIGVLFLLVAFLLAITPLTPGSLVMLAIGLELLDLREYVMEKLKRFYRR